MFLKRLLISTKDELIRSINFHQGLNLIVDETPSSKEDKTSSGNNVGKTTVIRLINFCLGANAKSIYQDPEFKKKDNVEVRSFLESEEVKITLELSDNLNNSNEKLVVIERNFLKGKKRLFRINEQQIKASDVDYYLKKAVLNYTNEKPSFKIIKAKHIREEAERLENTVKILNKFTSDS